MIVEEARRQLAPEEQETRHARMTKEIESLDQQIGNLADAIATSGTVPALVERSPIRLRRSMNRPDVAIDSRERCTSEVQFQAQLPMVSRLASPVGSRRAAPHSLHR